MSATARKEDVRFLERHVLAIGAERPSFIIHHSALRIHRPFLIVHHSSFIVHR